MSAPLSPENLGDKENVQSSPLKDVRHQSFQSPLQILDSNIFSPNKEGFHKMTSCSPSPNGKATSYYNSNNPEDVETRRTLCQDNEVQSLENFVVDEKEGNSQPDLTQALF